MIKIKNLTAKIKDLEVLKNINLEVNPGEIHAIMGARQSGKSSLVHAILGNPILEIEKGSILHKNKSIAKKTIEQRSNTGIYVTFQYLPSLDGITNLELARSIVKAHRIKKSNNQIEKEFKELALKLGLSSNHGHKNVNDETMTPTECKKNELLHMMLIDPSLIIFDELDNDVEEDEIENFALTIKEFLNDKKKSAIIVSHNKQFLDIIKPSHVNIMVNGTIQRKGSNKLLKRIVEDGNTQLP
jgi:Fe-S cluster assembly ATP-binding protein